MIEIKFDISDLMQISVGLMQLGESIDDMLPPALNNAGEQAYRETVMAVWREVPEVSQGVIKDSLIYRNATAGFPTFGIVANDSAFQYARWHTQEDEKVCPICAPRNLKVYTLWEAYRIYPAHPRNCRCSLEQIFLSELLANVGQPIADEAALSATQLIMNRIERDFQALNKL